MPTAITMSLLVFSAIMMIGGAEIAATIAGAAGVLNQILAEAAAVATAAQTEEIDVGE